MKLAIEPIKLAKRESESLTEYAKRFNHEKLFAEDFKPDVALVSFTDEVTYKRLLGKGP